jgi:hypothetical protein
MNERPTAHLQGADRRRQPRKRASAPPPCASQPASGRSCAGIRSPLVNEPAVSGPPQGMPPGSCDLARRHAAIEPSRDAARGMFAQSDGEPWKRANIGAHAGRLDCAKPSYRAVISCECPVITLADARCGRCRNFVLGPPGFQPAAPSGSSGIAKKYLGQVVPAWGEHRCRSQMTASVTGISMLGEPNIQRGLTLAAHAVYAPTGVVARRTFRVKR